jgi:hypothetical protein
MHAALVEQSVEELLLRGCVRMCDGVSVSALIGLDSFDNTMDAIALRERISNFLQNEDTAAFCSTVSVGRRIKRFTLTS